MQKCDYLFLFWNIMGFLRQKFFSERVFFALSLSPATIQEKDRN